LLAVGFDQDQEPAATDPSTSQPREPVRFLVFSASLRADSLNSRLASLAATTIEANGGIIDSTSMRDFDTPSYNADVQDSDGFPPGADRFRECVQINDAFVISCPEYNSSMPGLLKNSIDWVSRFSPQPFNEKHGLLLSASPSMVGGNRGLWALRVPFEHLGARIYPDMFSLAQAHQAFAGDGRIADPQLRERFESNIVGFMDLVEATKHYPCVKTRWVEYLGERPDPATDRVE
jgi:chromate reductase, NAD(P)H dehydrogenase (quinone)